MIVVFVVDTSPSMAKLAVENNKEGSVTGVSRLDMAKMTIESLARSMDKRVVDHNRSVLVASSQMTMRNLPHHVGRLEQFDEFILLSTSLQPDVKSRVRQEQKRNNWLDREHVPSKRARSSSFDSIDRTNVTHMNCGAGGRLLYGSVDSLESGPVQDGSTGMLPHPPNRANFERELKQLRFASLPLSDNSTSKQCFPEWAGGAAGLNTALSHGLGLLSRYRLTRGRIVENFGMGRLPWFEHQMATMSNTKHDQYPGKNMSPLQPACLVLVTDGECLRLPPEKGGGSLRLQFGNMPLREFYKEPFRWDQRVFILHIVPNSAPPLHSSLRALCEVTGGAVIRLQKNATSVSKLISRLCPVQPRPRSIPDPLRLPSIPDYTSSRNDQSRQEVAYFINGGPIVGFQAFERNIDSNMPSLHRAMLLFAGSCEHTRWIMNSSQSSENTPETQALIQSPIWSLPESFYPSKKLDVLPPRPSQPLVHYSRNFQSVGSSFFDPLYVMKALHHLEELHVSIRQLLVDFGENPPPIASRMLQRDVYICEWLGGTQDTPVDLSEENNSGAPRTTKGREHFPVGVIGAGRPTISGEAGENVLNIGILHVPPISVRLKDFESNQHLNTQSALGIATLTLLPPDAHILIPLLIKVAESELRALNKVKEKGGLRPGAILKTIPIEDAWKADFRAYLFRLPPYYLPAMRRALRVLLPTNVLQLMNPDGQEPLALQCMSRACINKINSGEQAAKHGNDWLRGVERNLAQQKLPIASPVTYDTDIQEGLRHVNVGYGNYDPRMTISSYKSSLRSMPPPWKTKRVKKDDTTPNQSVSTNILGSLPSSCLLPYYEARRRWIFGGTGLTTRGLHVEGTNNDGVNSHHYQDTLIITLADVGAETINQTSIAMMGDFRERLQWSRAPLTGYGGSNLSPVTTAPDGSPVTSVDDEVFPVSFFNKKNGDFVDTPHARLRARMTINFGNPFQIKRGGSIIPEQFESQRPSTPPDSPAREDVFESIEAEGEGEAAFTGKVSRSPRHRSPNHSTNDSLRDHQARINTTNLAAQPQKPLTIHNTHKPQPPILAQSSKPPPPPIKQSSIHIANTQSVHTQVPLDLQNVNQKPQINLPSGWICVWSKSQKRWYFFDTRTNKSVWEWPPPGPK